jgi:hypothetical protein
MLTSSPEVANLGNIRRVFMKEASKGMLLALVLAFGAQGANILVTQFDNATGFAEMEANLEAVGHNVTLISATTGGNVAAALDSGTYSQVLLFDVTSMQHLNAADLAALAAFWDNRRGLVVDTRSYGYRFQPSNTSEVTLLRNVVTNLELSGGGVWVGTDHDPDWTRNGNPFLSAIGVNPVTGSFSDPVNYADPSSVLLAGVTPTALWGGGQSVGQAPIGVQPNGIEMFIHFGHIRSDSSVLPYISASFPLSGLPPPPDGAIPEPSTMLMALGGIACWFMWHRKVA